MTFPTIPTEAATRVLKGVQTGTSGTRTFPSLTGLTKNAGDLLIAICVAYQTSTGTNAAFSGWGGGFTEFHDSATSTTLAIGIAYKWSTGSETGTFTVTQAGTITGEASFILLSIPGAHASTIPEAGARTSGTTAMADSGAFDPAGWAAEDTLWIAICGSGETNATGSYTTITAAPTNYTNLAVTAISSDTVGGVVAAVAFRQLNASSENIGVFAADVSNARNAEVVIAVRPAPTLTVPDAPTAVISAQTATTGELDVDWTAPGNDGGAAITGYNLRWSSNGGTNWTELGVEAGLTRLVTGLAILSHIFQASAVNSVGQGAWSSSSAGVIPNPWQTFSDGVSTASAATVTGLTNDTKDYEFRVAAVNAVGTGAWSNTAGPYTPTVPEVAPDPIDDLAGTPGDSEVVLTHTAPADGGSAITDYAFEFREASSTPSGLRYPTTRSGRHWLDQDGYRWLMKCMSSWGMPQALTNAEITTVLEALASFGFNSFVVATFGQSYNIGWTRWENIAGDPVFATTTDGTTPDTAFGDASAASLLGAAWLTMDHIINEAERLNLTAIISFYTGFGTVGIEGDLITAHSARAANAYDFGHKVATRYAAYPNIMWHVGADDNWVYNNGPGQAVDGIFHGVFDAEGAVHRLWWGEAMNGASAFQQWPSAFTGTGGFTYLRLDGNSLYDYGENMVDYVDEVWAEVTHPVLDCEPPYAGSPHYGGDEAQRLRQRNYTVFFQAGVGINYGDEDFWPFDLGGIFDNDDWASVLVPSTPTLHASYVWDLIDTYMIDTTWVPGGLLTGGVGTLADEAAHGHSDTTGLAYFPNTRASITVATTILAGTANVRLRWYDPTNGTYTSIAASEAQNASRSVTHPGNNAGGADDWVLVVDLADGTSGSSPGVWQAFADGTSTSTGTTVTGLVNDVPYDFQAAAINAIGQSAWSNIAGPYTPVGALEKLKRWNGSSWVPVVMKHGAAWDVVTTATL